ncbi:surface lipoprotein assembly modifier [Caulobacter hibisci]|uniref:DUF560 domain-containing protein n=1 Tax=Caulobacter hibisci TaxID=2035993 RepID=A0ABS0T4L9_9CAUL|nr:surface lipoprotein assembly modifier [Caulobacter hibisci]MBI1686823.1 DUF560 domain-containing protein [Caulobacter hibisci]
MRRGGRTAFAVLAGVLAATIVTGGAWAQAPSQASAGAADSGPVALSGDQAFATALKLMIRSGEHAQALALIDTRPDLADRADVVRLRAQLLALTGREAEGLALLESRLTRVSDDALARFQVGELHFAAGRDAAATLAYRLALAGRLDPVRRRVAEQRLTTLQDRRRWRFWAGGSIAPDSNVNGATDASRIEIFGLPFELDEEARRRGGVTVSAQGGVERRFAFEPGTAVRASLSGATTRALGGDFDDTFLQARAGPEWTLSRRAQVTAQASVSGRWFGGELLEVGQGLRIEAETAPAAPVRWLGALRIDHIDARINNGRDGMAYGLEAARTRFTGPSSLWRLSGSAVVRQASAPTEGFHQQQLAIGRLNPLPWSVLAYVEAYGLNRRYDGVAAAFGERRVDSEYGVSARLSKRDWTVRGAFPFLAVSVARNRSSLALNSFERRRMELGFTREF